MNLHRCFIEIDNVYSENFSMNISTYICLSLDPKNLKNERVRWIRGVFFLKSLLANILISDKKKKI